MAQPSDGLGLCNEFLELVQKYAVNSSASRIVTQAINVPISLRKLNETAYTPRTISIGLIHHKSENEEIKSMSEYKKIYFSRLLHRTAPECTNQYNSPHLVETVNKCTNAMLELAVIANMCYPKDSQLNQEDTARVMLLDGCFILELLNRWSTRTTDSFIQNRSTLNNLVHDLLLAENQIPFIVLEKLYELTLKSDPPSSPLLDRLILNFFCDQSNSHFKSVKIQSGSIAEPAARIDTLLGLVHSRYLPQQPQGSEKGDYMITRYSATEIFKSGINFKPSKNEEVYLDVLFKAPCLFFWFRSINITSIFLFPLWLAIFMYEMIFYSSHKKEDSIQHTGLDPDSRELPLRLPAREENRMKSTRASCCWLSFMCQLCVRATLEIPEISVTDSTESFFRNLIAYEQSSKDIPNHITSYAFLMDTIINTKEDIEMLVKSGVLKNYLGSSQVAADLFNSLCTNVILDDKFYFSGQWKQIDAYCNLYWPNLLGSLKVTYFSNPWTGISIFAALVLFAFTGLQTVGTVVQTWYKN